MARKSDLGRLAVAVGSALAAFCSAGAASGAPNWAQLWGESFQEVGSDQGAVLYTGTGSYGQPGRTSAGTSILSLNWQFREPQSAAGGFQYLSMKGGYEFDCRGTSYRIISATFWTGRNLTGGYRESAVITTWFPIEPNTLVSVAQGLACRGPG